MKLQVIPFKAEKVVHAQIGFGDSELNDHRDSLSESEIWWLKSQTISPPKFDNFHT